MALSYLPVDREQLFLLPPDMRDWLPESHLVWLVLDVLDQVDTSGVHALHPNDGVGRRAYDPEMLLALLIYAYCTGVRSSRRIERLCQVDVAYRVICGGWVPDHTTVARFRQGYERVAVSLFADVLAVCARVGLVKVGVVAVDGTKVAADASLSANRTKAQLEAEVAALFAEAEAVDAEEDARFGDGRGDELPEGLQDRRARAQRLSQALRELEDDQGAPVPAPDDEPGPGGQGTVKGGAVYARDRARAERQLARAEAEMGRLEAELASPASRLARAEVGLAEAAKAAEAVEAAKLTPSGKKRGMPRKTPQGRNVARKLSTRDRQVALAERRRAHAQGRLKKAKERAAFLRAEQAARAQRKKTKASVRAAEAARRAAKAQVNLTDPASRIMKAPGGWVQGYNAQAAVGQSGVVLAATVSNDHNDIAHCLPMMAAVEANLGAVGVEEDVGVMLFDAGYLSHLNLVTAGPPRLIATAKSWKMRRAAIKDGYAQGDPPPGASPIEAMEHRLRTKEGATLYGLRQHIVEPVFGHTKHNRGFRRFMRRGLSAAQAEWQLIMTTHNLLKLHRAATLALT
jgi:transposase